MAVAPVDKDGNVDYSHVVISYAGTNFGDPKDVGTDIQGLGLGDPNNLLTKLPTTNQLLQLFSGQSQIALNQYLSTSTTQGQPAGAVAFAKRVYKTVTQKNPNATFSTTGHSLGQALAMYAALKMGWNNVGFNGPDIGNMITPAEIDYMLKHSNQFRNYRNPNDILGNSTGNQTGTAIWVKMDGSKMQDFVKMILADPNLNASMKFDIIYQYFNRNHGASTWQFKNGQIVDIDGNVVSAKNDKWSAVLSATLAMDSWSSLKITLSASGLTTNEQIYLDAEQARIVADGFGQIAIATYDEVQKHSQASQEKVEELYRSLREVPWGFSLTPDEVLTAYANGGVNYSSTVGMFSEYSQKKLNKTSSIKKEIETLKEDIKIGIDKVIASDEELARDIASWINMS